METSIKSEHSINIAHYTTWFLTSFFYAFQMTLRVLPGIMMNEIMEKFNLNIGQYGLLAGFYYLGYAGAQIPLGLLLEKYHPRFVISFFICLCSIGLMCISFFDLPIYAYLGRFLIGVGSVAGILGSIKVINDFFSTKHSFMLGLTVLIGVSGAYYGGAPIKYMLNTHSFSSIFNHLAIFGFILAFVILVLYSVKKDSNILTDNISTISALKLCFANKKLWLVGICSGLMVGPLEGFADLWGIKYYIQVHNLSTTEAGFAISLIFLGMGVGGPLLGLVFKKMFDEVNIIIIAGIALNIIFMILFFGKTNKFIIYFLSLLIGLFSAYQVIAFSLINKIGESRLLNLMSSLLNMLIMSFGFIFHYCIGYVFEHWFKPVSLNNVDIYNSVAYNTAFSVILIGLTTGTIGFIYFNKKNR